jgi:GNAT superfamily N-acetyltransferase
MHDVLIVDTTQPIDIPSWRALATEVEPLFGPLQDTPECISALHRHVERGSAFSVRDGDGLPGTPPISGLLFSPRKTSAAVDRIVWLAVASTWQRHGIGSRIVEHIVELLESPSTLAVATFGDESPAGIPARRFYERLGFEAAEAAQTLPDGGLRQVFRRRLPS